MMMKFGTIVGNKIVSVINNFVSHYNDDIINDQLKNLESD
jgi:hypothetical protein